MNIDKLRKEYERLQSKGGNDDIYKLQYGTQILRLVPYKFDKDIPFTKLYFHYKVQGNKTFLSPVTFGKPDPIAELGESIRRESKDGWKKARKFLPQIRTLVPVIVRGEEDKGVRFWSFGKTVYEELIKLSLDPEYGDITDPMTGTDLKIEYIEPDGSGQMYPKTVIRPARKSSKLSDDPKQVEKWLEEQADATKIFPEPTYEELEESLKLWLQPSKKTEQDLEEESEQENSNAVSQEFSDSNNDVDLWEEDSDDEDVDFADEFDDVFAN